VKTVDALPKSIMALWEKVGDNEAALREGLRQVFLDHDKALARAGPLSYRESGSTATVALVTSKSVILAHVGDSPGLVIDSTTGKIIQEIKNQIEDVINKKSEYIKLKTIHN
jgi:serine/threonine protein phosphatase PrpC